MDYKKLNIEYRQAIIKAVGFLLTEGIKQSKGNPEVQTYERDARNIMVEFNNMLVLRVPDLPVGELPLGMLNHYKACIQLFHVTAKLVLRENKMTGSGRICTAYQDHTEYPPVLLLYVDSLNAIKEADSISPNPLADGPSGVEGLEAELYGKNCEIQRLKDDWSSLSEWLKGKRASLYEKPPKESFVSKTWIE